MFMHENLWLIGNRSMMLNTLFSRVCPPMNTEVSCTHQTMMQPRGRCFESRSINILFLTMLRMNCALIKIFEMSHVMRKLVLAICEQQSTDQPAHPRSLISTFVVRYWDSIIPYFAKYKISRLYLVSIAEQASLSLTWLETLKTDFLMTRLKCFSAIYRLLMACWSCWTCYMVACSCSMQLYYLNMFYKVLKIWATEKIEKI